MNNSTKSLIRGIVYVLVLSLIWIVLARSLFGLKDTISFAVGIVFIILGVGLTGYFSVPLQHMGIKKVLGRREVDERKKLEEGSAWRAPWENIETVNAKERDIDIPIITAISKDNVEMEIDVWAWWKVSIRPNLFLNLENPEKTAITAVTSKCTEKVINFVRTHARNQCLGAEKELQQKIKTGIVAEISQYGIEVTNIDVKSILPTKRIREELAEDAIKGIKTKRFTKDLKEISKEVPGLTDKEKVNTTKVVEGLVKEERKISEFESATIERAIKTVAEVVAMFLPKKEKTEKGGKK